MFSNKEYIYEVYKQKSFSKAAERLYISQPSLSLTIKKAEGKIGAQIFDRSTNPIQLTECGQEYIRCIERIMDIEREFDSHLKNLNELAVGSLSIGASNFFASYILPPIITRFKTQYPGMHINLVEADTANLEKLLFAGQLDLIVDNYEFNESIYTKYFFYSEKLLLAAPEALVQGELAKYALTTSEVVAGAHLCSETPTPPIALFYELPFILLRPGNDTRVRADKLFHKTGVKPNLVLELDQLATALHIVNRGLGVTVASDTLVREMRPDSRVRFFKLEDKLSGRDNYFYCKHNKYLTRAMEEFLRVAQS